MNILMITTNDPAGTAINFTDAINRYTSHRCRLITTEIRYNFSYKKDLHIPWLTNLDKVEYLLKTADIFHFHMATDENIQLGRFKPIDFIKGKKVIHHHHGEPPFRANPKQFEEREKFLGRRAIVSTPDLLKLYPSATWIPNPVPIYDVNYLPYYHLNGRMQDIVVGHSPTRKELKNTDAFLRVVECLKEEGIGIKPFVIENTPHRECLQLKRRCDIFFDHMQGYFGVSSLEALSQGVPTIAGLDEWNTKCVKEFTGADLLPWVIARNENELADKIRRLVSNSVERKDVGSFSRKWMEDYWTEERIATALAKFYEGL